MKSSAIEIVKRLREAGYLAYFVGGCVRDLVMGKQPKDYDIATNARPQQVMPLFPRTLTVGARFGVVLVVVQDGNQYEVATFRSDGVYRDGRRPDEVIYSDDPLQDVLRRDFTINGLLYDPVTEEVVDLVGGMRDIREKTLRTIGEPSQRFLEDHLRLIRAVRFSARFQFKLESATQDSIVKLSSRINDVSTERIREELVKILTEGYAERGIRLLDENRLLEHILPEVAALKGVEQPPEFHPEGDVWRHTLLMLGLMDQTKEQKEPLGNEFLVSEAVSAQGIAPEYPSVTLASGVLLHDVGKPLTFEVKDRIRFNSHCEVGARLASGICERFHFTRKQSARIVALVRDHLRFKDLPQMRASTLKRFLRQEAFDEHLELHRLDCLGSHRNLDNWKYAKEMLQQLEPEEIRPARLLSGDDLILMGYRPGPLFKEILRWVEDAQLEDRIDSRQKAEELVRSRFPLGPGLERPLHK